MDVQKVYLLEYKSGKWTVLFLTPNGLLPIGLSDSPNYENTAKTDWDSTTKNKKRTDWAKEMGAQFKTEENVGFFFKGKKASDLADTLKYTTFPHMLRRGTFDLYHLNGGDPSHVTTFRI